MSMSMKDILQSSDEEEEDDEEDKKKKIKEMKLGRNIIIW